MARHWQACDSSRASDPITAYRLSRDSTAYPGAIDTLWWSAIVHLRGASIEDFLQSAEAQGLADDVFIPNVYDTEDRTARPEEQSVTLFARAPLLRLANQVSNPLHVASVHLGGIVPSAHLTPFRGPPLGPGPVVRPISCPEGTVVMAVIDDGIAFGHNLLRDGPTSSRVALAYIMATSPGSTDPGENERETQGRVLDKRQIDALLAGNTTLGLLDEATFYRESGLIDFFDPGFFPAALRTSHGTHVAAVAAGYEIDAAPDNRPVICAILPPRVTEDTSGQSLYPSLVLALRRLRRHALRFRLPNGQRPPVVFNFSYGTLAGPHDGSGRIPRLIQRTVNAEDGQVRRMVLPAGNGNLTRTHARAIFETKDCVSLDLRVLPDDRTASYVEMWMPGGGANAPRYVNVRVTPPGGPQSPPVPAGLGSCQCLLDDSGHEIARLAYGGETGPGARGVMVLSINPTASLEANAKLAPAGRWLIEIERDDIAAGEAVEVWIRRDDTLPGFPPNGRQAHFDNADYQRFNALGGPLAVDPPHSTCPVRRSGTLSGIATGEAPLVIGGLIGSNGRVADYSAAGPAISREGPDASARSDHSVVLRGVLSAGSHSGSRVRLGGTSVAAPRVARFAAEGMAEGAPADREWLQGQAKEQDGQFPGPTPEATRTGAGRLHLPLNFRSPE